MRKVLKIFSRTIPLWSSIDGSSIKLLLVPALYRVPSIKKGSPWLGTSTLETRVGSRSPDFMPWTDCPKGKPRVGEERTQTSNSQWPGRNHGPAAGVAWGTSWECLGHRMHFVKCLNCPSSRLSGLLSTNGIWDILWKIQEICKVHACLGLLALIVLLITHVKVRKKPGNSSKKEKKKEVIYQKVHV